jgi:ketosteroid isomerase-like protein
VGDVSSNKALILEFWGVEPADKHRYFTDDVLWHFPHSVAVRSGMGPELHGPEVVALFGTQTNYVDRTWEIDHVLGEDDLVTLHCTMDGWTASGNRYRNSYHFLFRLADGRIAEGWEFLDTAYAFERIGPKLPDGDRA